MAEVWIPMLDGRWLVLPRHTQPEKDVQAVLNQCQITLTTAANQRVPDRGLRSARGCRLASFCGEDLGLALTESEGFTQSKTSEVRKSG
jgi:hypothetical protein